jgi:hypothetical protein
MPKEIKDDISHLKVSRQRKWALRNPDKLKEYQTRYEASEKAKERKKRYYIKNKDL